MSDQVLEPFPEYGKGQESFWNDIQKVLSNSPEITFYERVSSQKIIEHRAAVLFEKLNKEFENKTSEKSWYDWPSLGSKYMQLKGERREKLDVQELAQEQGYTGTDLKKIEGKWPGDEDIEDILKLL